MTFLLPIMAALGFLIGVNSEHQKVMTAERQSHQYMKQIALKDKRIKRFEQQAQALLRRDGVIITNLAEGEA